MLWPYSRICSRYVVVRQSLGTTGSLKYAIVWRDHLTDRVVFHRTGLFCLLPVFPELGVQSCSLSLGTPSTIASTRSYVPGFDENDG